MNSPAWVIAQLLLWIAFFIAQVTVLLELPLTVLSILLSALLLYKASPGERVLFGIGVVMALIIELGLGLIARSQHWSHASLFGIPYWLPLIWGYGFVVMRRIGNVVTQRFDA